MWKQPWSILVNVETKLDWTRNDHFHSVNGDYRNRIIDVIVLKFFLVVESVWIKRRVPITVLQRAKDAK